MSKQLYTRPDNTLPYIDHKDPNFFRKLNHIALTQLPDKAKLAQFMDKADQELLILIDNEDIVALQAYLATGNARVNDPDDEEYPLHMAIDSDETSFLIVSMLLSAGANPNVCTHEGLTPLHIAARDGNKDVVKLLLEHGAKVNVGDHFGNTPLHFTMKANSGCEELLLRAGADVFAINIEGLTPLEGSLNHNKINAFINKTNNNTATISK